MDRAISAFVFCTYVLILILQVRNCPRHYDDTCSAIFPFRPLTPFRRHVASLLAILALYFFKMSLQTDRKEIIQQYEDRNLNVLLVLFHPHVLFRFFAYWFVQCMNSQEWSTTTFLFYWACIAYFLLLLPLLEYKRKNKKMWKEKDYYYRVV